jgi:carboxyl-terminal processing protease
VQQLEQLRSGGVLKVTIARWYTPGGKNIDKEGITPDQEIKRSEDDITANRDPQKDKAIELLKR